jgi:ubiquinone/menaquinone biosynthesis C-methylase UbiE
MAEPNDGAADPVRPPQTGEFRELAWWRGYLIDNPLRRILHKPEKMLTPFVTPGMTVMDIGCGMGCFTVPMARMVGETGKVVAVEVQQEKLDVVMLRAARAGVASRISPLQCAHHDLGADRGVDFALAFYIVHEVPDPPRLLRQIHACLKPGGALLIAEPSFEVSAAQFEETIALARSIGFSPVSRPAFCVSRAVLLAAGNPVS